MAEYNIYENNSYICKVKQIDMKGLIKIGKITQEQILTVYKKASRDMDLENSTGWVSKHKVHKSVKDYNRKVKHKNLTL